MYVSVIAKSGAPIAGLGADFFAVREDGRDRDVLRAGPPGPMELALLIDTSSVIGTARMAPSGPRTKVQKASERNVTVVARPTESPTNFGWTSDCSTKLATL